MVTKGAPPDDIYPIMSHPSLEQKGVSGKSHPLRVGDIPTFWMWLTNVSPKTRLNVGGEPTREADLGVVTKCSKGLGSALNDTAHKLKNKLAYKVPLSSSIIYSTAVACITHWSLGLVV